MPSLTVKNLPDALLEELRARARAEHRSLNQQVIHLLRHAVLAADDAERRRRAERVAEQVDAWRRLAGRWDSAESVEEEVREVTGARADRPDVDL